MVKIICSFYLTTIIYKYKYLVRCMRLFERIFFKSLFMQWTLFKTVAVF